MTDDKKLPRVDLPRRRAARHAGRARGPAAERRGARTPRRCSSPAASCSPTPRPRRARFANEEEAFIYSRFTNPTVDDVRAPPGGARRHRGRASARRAAWARSCCSCMGLLKAGDHVVCSQSVFGSTHQAVRPRVRASSASRPPSSRRPTSPQWRAAVRPNTKLLFAETPTNPLTEVCDIRALADIAHDAGALLAVDNCFCSPALQRPIELGADLDHPLGHQVPRRPGPRASPARSAASEQLVNEKFVPVMRSAGMALSPFNAWVVLKGLETLSIRMQAQSARALGAGALARGAAGGRARLLPRPARRIRSTSWRWRSSRALGGAVRVVRRARRRRRARARANAFHVIDSDARAARSPPTSATPRRTITHPASTSHGRLTEEQRQAAGITQGMIRVAVGLDDVEDIKADLARGLDTLRAHDRMTGNVRTRFAPSPTGFLHLGTARTALYLLGLRAPPRRRVRPAHRGHRRRALDAGVGRRRSSTACTGSASTTTRARSTRCSAWTATARSSSRCWPTARPTAATARRDELDAMREAQRARGEKPRYDGRWRPEPGKTLPPVPDGVKPVMRFRNPPDGAVDLGRPGQGPDHDQQRRARRPGDRARRRHADLQLLRRGRRQGHAHHAT